MREFMNPPTPTQTTPSDIIAEYRKTGDKRRVAREYLISVSEVTTILKESEKLSGEK